MKFLFFGLAVLFSQCCLPNKITPLSPLAHIEVESVLPKKMALTATIDGNVVTYDRASYNRNAYDAQEESDELCYIGQGFLYSVNGVLQTQDVEKGARLSHYWAKGQ